MRALLFALALGLCAPAAATPTTPGRQQYELGARAFHEKRWADARRAFSAAYQIDHEPELLYDLALATWREASSDGKRETLTEARETYRRYLAEGPAARRRAQAEEALATIDAQLTPPPAPAPAPPPSPAPSPPDDRVPLDPYADGAPPPRPTPVVVQPVAPAPPSLRTDSVPPSSPPPPRRRWVTPVVVVGTLAAVALAVGLGVGLSGSSPSSGPKTPSLGTVSYP